MDTTKKKKNNLPKQKKEEINKNILHYKEHKDQESFTKAYDACEPLYYLFKSRFWSIDPGKYHDIYTTAFLNSVEAFDPKKGYTLFTTLLSLYLSNRCKSHLNSRIHKQNKITSELDAPISTQNDEDGTHTLVDTIPAKDEYQILETHMDAKIILNKTIDRYKLSDVEADFLLDLYDTMIDYGDIGLTEFARIHNIDRKRVDNICFRINKKIKKDGLHILFFLNSESSKRIQGHKYNVVNSYVAKNKIKRICDTQKKEKI